MNAAHASTKADDTADETAANSAISFSRDGKAFCLATRQFLPRSREEVFEFFSDATRLESLTPPWLSFHVVTPAPIKIQAGTLIDYRLSLHGIPLRWQSRISVWEPPNLFVDEQMRGPYLLWRHEHHFWTAPGGTVCEDRVRYRVFGGRLANWLLVQGDLKKIFAYRQRQLTRLLATGQ